MVEVGTVNKINIVYFLLLYVITLGIIKVCEKSYVIPIMTLTMLCVLFVNFEVEYFDTSKYETNFNKRYADKELTAITKEIEANENNEDADKYFVVWYKAEPYIYTLLHKKISPYELDEIKNKNYGIYLAHSASIASFMNYSFFGRPLDDDMIEYINSKEKHLVVINKRYTNNIEKLENQDTTTYEYGDYKIIKNY